MTTNSRRLCWPISGQVIFHCVDAHLKWVEVVEMPQTTTDRTIAVLRHLFSTHGIPEQIMSDNGPQFTSTDFAEYSRQMASNTPNLHHTTQRRMVKLRCLYGPSKEAMKTGKGDGLTLTHKVKNFLLTYRTTPHAMTNTPPCQLLMGQSLCTQ